MLELRFTSKFKKDYRRIKRQGLSSSPRVRKAMASCWDCEAQQL